MIWIKHGDGTASIAMLEPRGEKEAEKQQLVREGRSGSVSLLTISGKGGWHCTEMHRSPSAVMEEGSPAKEQLPPRSKSTPGPMRKGMMSVRLLEGDEEEEEEEDAGEAELNRVMSPQRHPKPDRTAGGGRGSPSHAMEETNKGASSCQRSSRSSSGRLVGNFFGGMRKRGSHGKMKLTDSTDSGGVRFVPCTLSCTGGSGEDGGSLPVHVWSDFAPLILLQDNVKVNMHPSLLLPHPPPCPS